jgi:hypothetical protein
MSPGTLYGSLDRMIEAGLVGKGGIQDPGRIYYRLTALGEAALRTEAERLSRGPRRATPTPGPHNGATTSPARLKPSRSLRLYARLVELYSPSFPAGLLCVRWVRRRQAHENSG